MTGHELSRKRFLQGVSGALVAGVAGCAGFTAPDGTSTANTTRTEQSSTNSDTAESTTTAASTLDVFFAGGEDSPVTDTEPSLVDGQAKVYAVKPNEETERTPVVMVPGLGLSPYIYLTTPDGRRGWAEHFAAAGHPTYAFDPPKNVSSSGLNTVQVAESPQSLSRWSLERAWPTWGFGPRVGEPYDETRYPVDHIDQLEASFPAYVSGGTGGGSGGGQRSGDQTRRSGDETTQRGQATGGGGTQTGGGQTGGGRFGSERERAALVALLDRVGPATLVVHSAGGPTGFEVARSHPDLVTQVVAVEPVGCPTETSAVAAMAGDAQFMAVYGDYVQERGQTGRQSACQTTVDLTAEAGGDSTLLDLPATGIRGNTHLMMQDDNNLGIADRIVEWIRQ